jgi:hypothetical protein
MILAGYSSPLLILAHYIGSCWATFDATFLGVHSGFDFGISFVQYNYDLSPYGFREFFKRQGFAKPE